MFVVAIKTLLTDAMRQTFDSDYVEPDFRNLLVSIEFPMRETDYPSIWVETSFADQLEIVGINHREATEADADGNTRQVTRWRFAGYVTYTVVALSSLERDRIFDEVVKVLAFGHEQAQTSEFRAYIESNEFIAMNMDFDQIRVDQFSATPGTPWGSDEMVYEASISMEMFGEFVSDGTSRTLVPLKSIVVTPFREGEPDPLPGEVSNPWM